METAFKAISIRTFIGAKDYQISRSFYRDLGFQEFEVAEKMCWFTVNEQLGFYLQDYYLKEWIENSMIFLEVENVEACREALLNKNLVEKYPTIRFTEIRYENWGREFFMHDPAGVLWHFGNFKKIVR